MTKHTHLRTTGILAALILLTFGLGACLDSDEAVIVEPVGGDLFQRYVALGNSITAGFQSAGIHVQLQRDAYPVLLAEKANARFGIPALSLPGCPPPLDAPLGERIADVACAGVPRILTPPPLVQNLAVPGGDVSDVSDPLGTGTPLNAFILGGRTQIGAMLDAQPTLVSVWIGNNDALEAALSGDPAALTPLDDFRTSYDEVVTAILQTDAQDAILIGAAQMAAIVPALQPGAYFWAIAQNPPPGLPDLDVNANCAPFTPTGQPNPTAFNLVSFRGLAAQIEAGADPVVVDCANDAPSLLNPAEQEAIATHVAAFNAHIQERAEEHGWIYVDPNTSLIGPALQDPDLVRKCQNLPNATDPASFQAAVVSSCPVDLDPDTEETFFGVFFSFDGVHPSSVAHQAIADSLAGRLNEKHGISLP